MQEVFTTLAGTSYLTKPAATCIIRPKFTLTGTARQFLLDYDEEFEAAVADYLQVPAEYEAGAAVMFAGQLCYLSFGGKRTPLDEMEKYLKNILSSGHGSVLEHVNFSFLLYGIDRATTHELVRHRVGFAVSQVSQRFVNADRVRFVLPWEDQTVEEIARFEEHIDRVRQEYEARAEYLMKKYPLRENERPTDHRKRIQSSARSVLTNDVEAPCVITINGRSARHIIALRTSPHADVRIRRPFIEVLRRLQTIAPELFGDFQIEELPDGSFGASTQYPKP